LKTTERKFDLSLLKESDQKRKDFFKKYTVIHPKFVQVKKAVLEEIHSSNYNVIMVIGPSRIGKSRLIGEIIDDVEAEMKKEMNENRGIIPIAGMELPNPDLRKFNWKDFYFRVLTKLKEPMINDKIDIERNSKGEKKKPINPTDPGTAPELRRSIERAFDNRETKAFLIDEAQHFFSIGGGSTALETQFNSIKSLSNMAGTKFVMFGTYGLNSVINLDGQLTSRVLEIHFPRYDVRIKEDEKLFKSIVYSFQKVIPVEVEPNLLEHTKFLYDYSIGCVGLLKQWLERCLSDALNKGEKTITLENLKKNALNLKKLKTLAREAIDGERDFLEKEEDKKELEEMLYNMVPNDEEAEYEDNKVKNTNTKHRSSNGRLKPGQRNPGRDEVGNVG
jgi:hypothetical protein